jgi:hypothetical protein
MIRLVVLIVILWLIAIAVHQCTRPGYNNRSGPTQDGGVGGQYGGRADGR